MNAKTLILHLKRATDRRKQVDLLKTQSPLPVEIVYGIDGSTLDPQIVQDTYQHSLYKPHYPFELRIAEIACFLSHRKCWQTILDQNLDAAFIVEDDVVIDDAVFRPAFELATQNHTPADYIRFPMKRREEAAVTRAASSTHELFFPQVTGVGMQGQFVGKEAARKLLAVTKNFDRPVDTLLQMTWVTDLQPLCVCPSGISEISAQLGGSRIGQKKSWREILRREILRPLYRHKIAAHAKSNCLTHAKVVNANLPPKKVA